ncbi:hypothetical protein [Brassicibacter mesophilus]|uniref:hypothetical protein n=1 Tax=Brassicibacter mesophilus TaxID=745119 RepID=UPI003D2630D8
MGNRLLLEDVLKEFIFDREIRNLSKRTIKSYRNNNLRLITYLKEEFAIELLQEVTHQHIKLYFQSNYGVYEDAPE